MESTRRRPLALYCASSKPGKDENNKKLFEKVSLHTGIPFRPSTCTGACVGSPFDNRVCDKSICVRIVYTADFKKFSDLRFTDEDVSVVVDKTEDFPYEFNKARLGIPERYRV